MDLLIHNNFSFKNILKSQYKCLKDKPDIICKVKMANGAIKNNYRQMPKTTIKATFGKLNRETYRQYISHFLLPEDNFTFYDTSTGNMLTKRFAIERNDDSLDFINDDDETHDEFSVTLSQIDEVEVSE